MPLYVYICKKCNARIEELQKFDDPPLTRCNSFDKGPIPRSCDGELEKETAQRGSFHLKGPGWYSDGYHNPWGQGNKHFEDTTLDKSATDMGFDQGQRDDLKTEAMGSDELFLPGVHKADRDKKGFSDNMNYND